MNRLSTAIQKQLQEGPEGDRIEVLACYGGLRLILCWLGKHDAAQLSKTVDGVFIYREVCCRCGRLMTHIRCEGVED